MQLKRASWSKDDAGATGAPALGPSDRSFAIGLAVVLASLVSAVGSFFILMGMTGIVPRHGVVVFLMVVNIVLIIAMILIIAWQVADLRRAWIERVPGARLHIRIVALFSALAALPAILLAVAATTSFSRTFDSVSARTRGIVENSLDVVNAYLEEHGAVIRTDVVNMAKDLDDAAERVRARPNELRTLLLSQAGLRDLPVAYIIDAKGQPLAAALENEKLPYAAPPESALKAAEAGQVPLLMPGRNYRVGAVVKLANYPGSYLYVVRGVSAKLINQLRRTQDAIAEYDETRRRRGRFTFLHGAIYFMLSLTALLAAIWAGMWFAGRFVAPIRRLIGAAKEVSHGNLAVELPVRRGEGDLRRLSEDFNTMTRELKSQRDKLVSASAQIDERRRFMEAVLSAVSAGVIGLDAAGRITLASRAAQSLLALPEGELVGKRLAEAVPDFAVVIEQASEPSIKVRPQHQISMNVAGEERTFAVRVTREEASGGDGGSVLTFDDISELVSAQRTSAWADVARRIAHEIKNPLTPIMLSADRLRRKYGNAITKDKEIFEKLTSTIERQAGDIKTMVDEFAAFARVPKPVMELTDLREAVQDGVILFREGHPQVSYELKMPRAPVAGAFDRRLITQAVTNLVKNATEAVESAADGSARPKGWKGRVETVLQLAATGDRVVVEVIDNGVGLPKQNRTRLLEPYVTTKGHKGTGLGLAIVQKIVEQHGGALTLEDAPPAPDRPQGALVRITLPLRPMRDLHPDAESAPGHEGKDAAPGAAPMA